MFNRRLVPTSFLTVALPILASLCGGCAIEHGDNLPPAGESGQQTSEPAKPAAKQDCMNAVQPPREYRRKFRQFGDGVRGRYLLDGLDLGQRFTIGSSQVDAGIHAYGRLATFFEHPGRPQLVCSSATEGTIRNRLTSEFEVPYEIYRASGLIRQQARYSLDHHGYTSSIGDEGTSNWVFSSSGTISDYAARLLQAQAEFYEIDPTHLVMFVTYRSIDRAGNVIENRLSARYVYEAPSDIPAPSPAPVPTVSPTPTPSPSASPAVEPAPAAYRGPLCGVSGQYITIGGNEAFYVSDSTERLNTLVMLIKSGTCEKQTRLGVSGQYITLDQSDAFYVSSSTDRIDLWLKLNRAGLGEARYSRCGVSGQYITLDGNDAFYISSSTERAEKLMSLVQSGICEKN